MIAAYQQEKLMPFLTIADRMAMKECLLQGLEVALHLKFGDEGLKLMPELRELRDHVLLGKILKAIEPAASPDALRRLWTRKRRSKRTGRARSSSGSTRQEGRRR